MNICITNLDSQPQFIGGIKRVCATLANQWIENGHTVRFVCLCENEMKYDNVAGIPQVQIPDTNDIHSEENVRFFSSLLKEVKIDVILHPFLDCQELTRLCLDVAERTGTKIITVWHFSPDHFLKTVDESFFALKTGNLFIRYTLDILLWLKWHLYKRSVVINQWSRYFKYCLEKCDRIVHYFIF